MSAKLHKIDELSKLLDDKNELVGNFIFVPSFLFLKVGVVFNYSLHLSLLSKGILSCLYMGEM